MPKYIQAEKLRKLCIDIFMKAGTSKEETEIVVDNLLRTSLRGVDSHGVRNIPNYINLGINKGGITPGAPIIVLKDTPTTAMWNNNNSFGFVAGKKAMETAMRKADDYGIGAVGTCNPEGGFDHIGSLGYYSEMAALKDKIGIVTCSTMPLIAAWGGASRVLGNNPISIAVPAGKYPPIVWDVACSQVAAGHLMVMAMRGDPIPEGWILNKEGQPTTDPKAFFEGGAMMPFGTYKGYGLATVIDAITGGLGAGCSFDNKRYGHLFIAIDPSGFTPLQDFKARVDRLIEYIKASSKRPGAEEVFVAGEIEKRTMKRRLKEGIPIDDPDWEALSKTARELGVNPEKTVE
jgi:LDH2 family malate/lactate/ureidoglycolate dehydrogenase